MRLKTGIRGKHFLLIANLLLLPALVTAQNTATSGTNLATSYPNLTAAVKATSAGQTLVVPAGTYPVPASVSVAGITIQCQRGATIQATGAGAIEVLRIAGTDSTIDGCTVDGNAKATNSITIWGATNATINKTTVKGARSDGIYLTNSTNTKLFNITSTGNGRDPIFAQDNISGLEIASGLMDDQACKEKGGCHKIAVHTWGKGGTASNINIHDVTIQSYTRNYGIEVGAFSDVALQPDGVNIHDNHEVVMAGGTNGLASCSTVVNCRMAGNMINANHLPMYDPVFELVLCQDCSVIDNKAENCIMENSPAAEECDVTINGSPNAKVIDNIIPGLIVASPNFRPATSPPYQGASIDGAIIEGNTLSLPPTTNPTGWPPGVITVQCTLTVGKNSASHLTIAHNHIIGQSATIKQMDAIALNNGSAPACTMDRILIEGNDAQAVSDGVRNISNSVITNVALRDNLWGSGVPQTGINGIAKAYCANDPGFPSFCTPR